MLCSSESIQPVHIQIKNENSRLIESNSYRTCPTPDNGFIDHHHTVSAQNFLDVKPFTDGRSTVTSKTSVKSIRHLFPVANLEEVNKKLNDPANFQNQVERSISADAVQKVESILQQISYLTPIEKLLLYLKLPTGREATDPLKQPVNPLGSRPEISQTIMWIKTHFKDDKAISIPKQDVYNEYTRHCEENKMKPLSTADFGKVMKQVYPEVRPRRLGTRGNSRYCYAGMSKRDALPTPFLPSLPRPCSSLDSQDQDPDSSLSTEGEKTICTWASKVIGLDFSCLSELEKHLSLNNNSNGTRGPSASSSSTPSYGDAYTFSSKIFKRIQSPNVPKKVEVEPKRKHEEESNSSSSSSKTPPKTSKERKKRVKKATTDKTTKEDVTAHTLSPQKLPIPKLSKPKDASTSTSFTLPVAVKKQKLLQPKPAESETFENGNSLEQEEELLKYFQQSGSKPASQDDPGKSTLRMLLEKCNATSIKVTRRVSFDNCSRTPVVPLHSPSSQENTSGCNFVPISPICEASTSQFLSPRPVGVSSPQSKSSRSGSAVNAPLLHGMLQKGIDQDTSAKKSIATLTFRSQSVPTAIPSSVPPLVSPQSSTVHFPLLTDLFTDTPVPSELIDFDPDNTFPCVIIGEDSGDSSHITIPSQSDDNLNQIFGFIQNIPSIPKSNDDSQTDAFSNHDPVVSALPKLQSIDSFHDRKGVVLADFNLLEEDLPIECDDPFNDFAREVANIGSVDLPPDS